ncbi:MAG: SIMPL domain-containing protein [Candidatus Geothermarchaeales archaeon]
MKPVQERRWMYMGAVVAVAAVLLAGFYSFGLLTPSTQSEFHLSFPTPGYASPLLSISSPEATEQIPNTISVTGTGKVFAAPDLAVVSVGVVTQAQTAAEAVRLNAEKMSAVIDEIVGLGIPEENIKTTSFSVYPVYSRYDKEGVPEIEAYRASNIVEVRLTDLSKIGDVIDKSVEAGANQIHGVSFSLSDEAAAQIRDEGYVAALEDTVHKATLIAESLDLTITGVLYVSEVTFQPYQPYRVFDVAIAEAGAVTPILEGELSVTVSVHVVFTFE